MLHRLRGTLFGGVMVAALLSPAGTALAGETGAGSLDLAMNAEIQTAWTSLQVATEKIGCLVTASGENEPRLTRVLDTLHDGEVRLRQARRLAQSASTDSERAMAIEHARATLALVLEAEAYSKPAGVN